MKIRKELWFGFSLMAVLLAATAIFTPWGNLLDGLLGGLAGGLGGGARH